MSGIEAKAGRGLQPIPRAEQTPRSAGEWCSGHGSSLGPQVPVVQIAWCVLILFTTSCS
jgi:hypothetical protein